MMNGGKDGLDMVTMVDGRDWTFLDTLSDGAYLLDRDGHCLFVNAAAMRLFGFANQSDVLGHNMHDLVHHTRPDGTPLPQAECRLLHPPDGAAHVTLDREMLWRQDGTPFFAQYSSYPLPGSSTGARILTMRELPADQGTSRGTRNDERHPCRGNAGLARHGLHPRRAPETFWRSAPPPEAAFALPADGHVPAAAFIDTIFPAQAREARRAHLAQGARGRERCAGPHAARSRSSCARRRDLSGGTDPAAFLRRRRGTARGAPARHQRSQAVSSGWRASTRRASSPWPTASAQLSWMTDPEGYIYWYNKRWYEFTGTTFEQMAGWGWKSVHHPDHVERVERRWRQCFDVGPALGGHRSRCAARMARYRWFLSRAHAGAWISPTPPIPTGRIVGWIGTKHRHHRDARRRTAPRGGA